MKISRTIPIFLISAVFVFGTTISMGIPTSFVQPTTKKNIKINIQKTSRNYQLFKKNKCNNINIIGIDNTGQDIGNILGGITEDNDWIGQQDQWFGNSEKQWNDNNNNINFCVNLNVTAN